MYLTIPYVVYFVFVKLSAFIVGQFGLRRALNLQACGNAFEAPGILLLRATHSFLDN